MPTFTGLYTFDEFKRSYPFLHERIQTLFHESEKAGTPDQIHTFTGDYWNCSGVLVCRKQYGTVSYKLRVKNGTLFAFGRQANLRYRTRMYSEGKLIGNYAESSESLLKDPDGLLGRRTR